jgi:exportin-5
MKAANKQDDRMQRSIILDLLSSIKGVSIHEQGKIERAPPKKKSAFQEQYMSVDEPVRIARGTSPELAGVADMFGDS